MKVTPLDIRRKEFRRSVRGYLDEDVDVFLDTVADEYERVSKLNADLQEKVRVLEEEISGHSQIRGALEKTLVGAQLQSEEIRSTAQKESQSMLREAEAKAKAVVDEFYAQTRAVQQTLIRMKLLEEDFRFKFKTMLEGYLELLKGGPIPLSGLRAEPEGSAVPEVVIAEPEVIAPAKLDIPEIDDNPTSETIDAGITLETVSASAAPAKPLTVPQPPRLPKPGPATKASAAISEDQTVETTVLAPTTRGGVNAKSRETGQPDVKDAGVYFGRVDEYSDDPFPEIGGDSKKPRDFEW